MSKVIALALFGLVVYLSWDVSISGYYFLLAWAGFAIALHFVLSPDDAKRFWRGK